MATPQSVPGPPINPTAPLTAWSPEQWVTGWQAKTDAQGGTIVSGILTTPAVTGGTIDGATIGSVTPGGGTFSTLTAATGGALGGTFSGTPNWSGAHTFSATGTALAVTNNATIGGTLGVTGAAALGGGGSLAGTFSGTPIFSGAVTHASTFAQQGNMTLGPGGSSATQIAQSGTGNWQIVLGSTSSLLNFRNSANALLFQVGGVSGQVTSAAQFVSQMQGTTSPVFSGSAVSAMAPWYQSLNWTGSCSVSGQPGVLGMYSFLNNAVASAAGSGTAGTSLNMTMGAASTGTAHLLTLTVNVPVTTANTSPALWSLLNGTVTASAMQGGTGLTAATAKGSVVGFNPNAQMQSGAINFGGITTAEHDLSVAAGASVLDKVGWSLVLTSPDAVQGARDDVAISLNNQFVQTSGSNSGGWQVGLGFGRQGGYFPISPTGTLIKTTGNVSGDSQTAAIGIDFSSATFSAAFLKSVGVLVDGAGNGIFASYTVGASGSPTITSGSGAPTTTQPNGSLWLRNDGSVSTRLYVSEGGGTWAAIASA